MLNLCSTHPCVHDGDGLFLNVDEIHKNKWIRYEDVFRRNDDQNVKVIIIARAKRFGCWTVMSRHDVCIRNQLYQVHWTLIFNFVVSLRSHSIRFDFFWQFEFLFRFSPRKRSMYVVYCFVVERVKNNAHTQLCCRQWPHDRGASSSISQQINLSNASLSRAKWISISFRFYIVKMKIKWIARPSPIRALRLWTIRAASKHIHALNKFQIDFD